MKGVCDDNTNPSLLFDGVPSNITGADLSLDSYSPEFRAQLKDMYMRGGAFDCYSAGSKGGRFLVYDPPQPSTSAVVHTQLPQSTQDFQDSWVTSDFQFGEPCRYGCINKGFMVENAGIGTVNDAGSIFGGGGAAGVQPTTCGGCQEEVITCLSSAEGVRGSKPCTSVPVRIASSDEEMARLSRSRHQARLSDTGSCSLRHYQYPWIMRNRNAYALPGHEPWVKKGTNEYFYMLTLQGPQCGHVYSKQTILQFIKDFARGFQGLIDVWRLQPACNGKCVMMSGAYGAWMTYSTPVVISVLSQLRAWASLKIDDIQGCEGNQAVLKFAAISVTDDGVVCCPHPQSGGQCNQNYQLPSGWNTKLREGTDEDFAEWMAETLGAAGSCPNCAFSNVPYEKSLCPGNTFANNDTRCKAITYKNYIPRNVLPQGLAYV